MVDPKKEPSDDADFAAEVERRLPAFRKEGGEPKEGNLVKAAKVVRRSPAKRRSVHGRRS